MKKGGDKAWLLIKHRDKYAVSGYDSEKQTPKSSPINKALAVKAIKRSRVKKPIPERKASSKTLAPERIKLSGLSNARKVKDPVKPMLATLGTEPFDDKEWLFEIKWDGYRAIAETGGKETRLYSRNGLSFLEAFRSLRTNWNG